MNLMRNRSFPRILSGSSVSIQYPLLNPRRIAGPNSASQFIGQSGLLRDLIGSHHFVILVVENMAVPDVAGPFGRIERVEVLTCLRLPLVGRRPPHHNPHHLTGHGLGRVFPPGLTWPGRSLKTRKVGADGRVPADGAIIVWHGVR